MWHRPLSEMLIEIFDAVAMARTEHSQVSAKSVELTLPIEVWFREVDGESTFIADLPVWRWRTVFDQAPSRLRITWQAGPA